MNSAGAERTGEGQHIDLALLDVQVAFLANQAANWLVGGQVPQRLGSAHPNIVPYQPVPAADGHFMLAVGNDAQFARLCEVIACAEPRAGPATPPTPRARGASNGAWCRCWKIASASSRAPSGWIGWKPSACPARRSTASTKYSPTAGHRARAWRYP